MTEQVTLSDIETARELLDGVTVTVVGDGVDRALVGTRVAALTKTGGWASAVLLDAADLVPVPAGLDPAEAETVVVNGITAWQMLRRARVGAGSTVLVHGANGGVGSTLVQLARSAGARVIGTASPANHEFLRSLGADRAVEYGEGLADRVHAVAPGGVDVVADFVGGVVGATMAVLKPGGRHASVADAAVLRSGGMWVWVRPTAAGLTTLARLADEGRLTVPVAEVFPLQHLADAFAMSRTGHTRGKIILNVSD